jgi:hypothetical protein
MASRQLLAGCVLLAVVGAAAQAQQTTGVTGSPDAHYDRRPVHPCAAAENLRARSTSMLLNRSHVR